MLTESLISAFILGIVVLFLHPGHLTMPDSTQSMLVVGLIVAFLSFSAVILKDQPQDERESLHILRAGRLSYLAGTGTLIIGIIYQTLSHEVDPWLVIALSVMVLFKLFSRIHSHFRG